MNTLNTKIQTHQPRFTPGIVDKIIKQTEEIISSEARRIYKVRPEAIIARDLRHAVFRELAYKVNKEVLKIDQFEKENSADIRNFDSDEEEQN
jgi:hypothetical protein